MIVGLDIGTSKVVCIVGKYNENAKLEIVQPKELIINGDGLAISFIYELFIE